MPLVKGLRPAVEVEGLLIDYFGAQLSSDLYYVCTIIPPDDVWTGKSAVRFSRASGAFRNRFTDRPIVDADVFGPDTQSAINGSQEILNLMLGMRNLVTPSGIVSMATVVIGPRWLPETNQSLMRRSATYEMHVHPLPNS